MLTFEDFFKKKKIDLQQLQQAEPGLFEEFSTHYPLMGEKSFDHTKKYWFNILRRSYPLAEAIKPHAVRAEAISPMAVQGVAVAAAQNIDAGIERPKFAENNLPELVDENVLKSEVSLTEEEKNIKEADPEIPTAKPTFKPHFNAKNIKKPEAENVPEPTVKSNPQAATENLQPEAQPAKPAFKPRFNMQNIKKDVVKEVSETKVETPEPEAEIKPEAKTNSEPTTEDIQVKTSPAKPAFKPRFNMQNIKKDVVKEVSEIQAEISKIEAEVQAEPVAENQNQVKELEENKEAKPVYKPRFQMKNVPKPPNDQA